MVPSITCITTNAAQIFPSVFRFCTLIVHTVIISNIWSKTGAAVPSHCTLCIHLHWEAWLEEHRSLPALQMKRTARSWPGRRRWAEPTEMSDFLQPLLTPHLQRNTQKKTKNELRMKQNSQKKNCRKTSSVLFKLGWFQCYRGLCPLFALSWWKFVFLWQLIAWFSCKKKKKQCQNTHYSEID